MGREPTIGSARRRGPLVEFPDDRARTHCYTALAAAAGQRVTSDGVDQWGGAAFFTRRVALVRSPAARARRRAASVVGAKQCQRDWVSALKIERLRLKRAVGRTTIATHHTAKCRCV